MVGNDVVDLRGPDADPETYRPRFDARVFSDAERAAIRDGADASRIRWRLWSAKEAAYKAARRVDSRTPFSPIRFAVELGDASDPTAIVRHGEAHFAVRFRDGRDFVHAVATFTHPVALSTRPVALSTSPVALSTRPVATPAAAAAATDAIFDAMLIGHARIASPTPDRQSALARAHAAEALAARWGVDPSLIGFERVGRVPQILLEGRRTRIPVSLSHHGDHVAWAFALAGSRASRMCARSDVRHAHERIAS